MAILGALLFVFSGIALAQTDVPRFTVARWSQDRVAAISLTFDDGMNSHLEGTLAARPKKCSKPMGWFIWPSGA